MEIGVEYTRCLHSAMESGGSRFQTRRGRGLERPRASSTEELEGINKKPDYQKEEPVDWRRTSVSSKEA